MNNLFNAVKLHAALATSSKTFTKLGTISGYDPVNRYITVVLQPIDDEGQTEQTGWIPLTSPWVGNGWGMFCAPSIDDLCVVHFQEGNLQAAFATQLFFNQIDQPLNVPSGEFWLQHATGSFLKLTNDGKLSVNGQVEIDLTAPVVSIVTTGNVSVTAGGNATVTATGTATIQGATVNVVGGAVSLGDGVATATAMALFAPLQTYVNAHVHTNGNGGANTGAPTTLLPSNTATTIVKAA